MRVIAKFEHAKRMAKVYRDSIWNEYRVKFYINTVHLKEADYHTTDKDDALLSAQHWVQGEGAA